MQTTSSGWNHIVGKSFRTLQYGVLISWMRQIASGVKFFTINQSSIGGPDPIKGGGNFVTLFDKYYYTDYSTDTISWAVSRKLGQFPYGVITAQADIELDNTSKKFLPAFDPTIGSGILPNRPVKISVGFDNESYKQFVGFTDMPENTLNNRVTTLHAYDVMDFVKGYVSTASGSQSNKYAHEVIQSLLIEAGFASTQYVLDSSLQQPIGYLATNNRKFGDIFRELCEAEQALMFSDENGIIRFWNRQHLTTISGTVAFQFNYSKLANLRWQNTPIINDVIVRAKPRAVAAKQRIFDMETATAGVITLLPGKDTDYFIYFSDQDGPLPVTSVDIPVYIDSATTSYFVSNENADGSGLPRNSNVTIVSAYSFGNSYKLTFRNSHTSAIYITQLVVYATPAKVAVVIEERYQDASSISIFGRNPTNNGEPLIIENDLIQEKDTARALAFTLVKEYKDPRKRYLAPVAVGSNPALQIGDFGRLTIGDTLETKNVFITGITTTLDRDGDLVQTLELEERGIKRYFTINQSKIAGLDTIAP